VAPIPRRRCYARGVGAGQKGVGKTPERYKLVEPGTIFYNPMRILLGSIALLDQGQEPGITSPDYVVFKTQPGLIHPRWLYYWLRSEEGARSSEPSHEAPCESGCCFAAWARRRLKRRHTSSS